MIDDELVIPMKQQGYLDMYNGVDMIQTPDYIKILSKSFIDKICEKYLISWMQNFTSTDDHPTSLPTNPTWFKKFHAAVGDPDTKVQASKENADDISLWSGRINMGNDDYPTGGCVCKR